MSQNNVSIPREVAMVSKSPTIMIIDDDVFDRESVRRSLKNKNIRNPVRVADDGEEALAILRGTGSHEPIKEPYIILLDWNMPRMNGLEFLIELRADESLKRAVVFVLTTSREDSDRYAAYGYHVAGYIVKRQDSSDFSKVATLLEEYFGSVLLPAS